MYRRVLVSFMTVAGLAFLLCVGPAAAQQGQGLYQWSGGGGGSSGGSFSGGFRGNFFPQPSYPAAPTYNSYYGQLPGSTALAVPQTAAPYMYGSLSTGADLAASSAVLINMSVPGDAEIWFEGAKTAQTGTLRRFVSPPLAPGRDYVYDIKAKWTENGKQVVQSRRVAVHAGDVVNVSFNPGAPRTGTR